MTPAPRTPEITCPWGHPIRPDGSHTVQADLELHVWHLVASKYPSWEGPCVNAELCIYAGAPWHLVNSTRHQEPPGA